MPNMFRAISLRSYLVAALLIGCLAASAWSASSTVADADEATPVVTKSIVRSRLATPHDGMVELSYSLSRRTLSLSKKGVVTTLDRVEEGKNPELIGTEDHIRLLPLKLQPYLSRHKIAFLFSVRTRANDGGGQCGSGEELYLEIADLAPRSPMLVSKVLVASCAQGIDLASDDASQAGVLSSFSVSDGKLHIEFLNYKSRDKGFTAELSSDLSTLVFR